jgi:hypothetical protein
MRLLLSEDLVEGKPVPLGGQRPFGGLNRLVFRTIVFIGITTRLKNSFFCYYLQSLLTDLHPTDYNLSCVVSWLGCIVGLRRSLPTGGKEGEPESNHELAKLNVLRGPCE